MSDLDIELYEPAEVPDAVLRRIHEIFIEREVDFMPDDPPTPFEHLAAFVHAPTGDHRNDERYVARRAGEIVGYGQAVTWADHEDTGLVTLGVARAARGNGYGRALLREGAERVASHGRAKFIVDAPQRSPFEPALRRLGMKDALGERISRLIVSDIDLEMMDDWITRASERAADYDLVMIDDTVPDELLDRWCEIEEAMNTAPLEDLELDDETMTPAKWRAIEETQLDRGSRMRAAMAIHRPTGAVAGMTNIYALTHHPTTAEQDDTVVHPDHRNKGLGRWLKAANIRRFLVEFPQVERIYTGNADSNEPMLNINVAMGFRPAAMFTAWQGAVVDALAHLDG